MLQFDHQLTNDPSIIVFVGVIEADGINQGNGSFVAVVEEGFTEKRPLSAGVCFRRDREHLCVMSKSTENVAERTLSSPCFSDDQNLFPPIVHKIISWNNSSRQGICHIEQLTLSSSGSNVAVYSAIAN